MSRGRREFSWVEGLSICLAMIGVQLSSEVMNQWGTYFYSPSVGVGRTIYVAIGLVGWIFIAGTVWDALTDPLIGAWSDKTRTRPGLLRIIPLRGRRRPFIFWGSILMTFSAIAFWYPPVDGLSHLNFIYGTVLLCMHWTFFTVTTVPLISLPPEIARSERERVRLGTFVGVGMIVGLALAAVAPGELITLLDPARTESRLVAHFPAGTPPESIEEAMGAMLPGDAADNAAVYRDTDRALRVRADETLDAQLVLEAVPGGVELVVTGALLDTLDCFDGPYVGEAVRDVLPAADGEAPAFESGPFSLTAVYPAAALASAPPDALRARVFARLGEQLGEQVPVEAGPDDTVRVLFTGSLVRAMDRQQVRELMRQALPEAQQGLHFDVDGQQGGFAAAFTAVSFPFDPGAVARDVLAPVFDAHFEVVEAGGVVRVTFYRELLKALNFAQVERRMAAALPDDAAGGFDLHREEGAFSALGYRRLAWALALLSLALFQLPVWLIRERYDSESPSAAAPVPYLRGLRDAARNRPFVVYFIAFFMFSAGFLAAQRALPYWAELGLGGDEGTVTLLMVPFIVMALGSYAFIPALTRRLHVKWMMVVAFFIIASGLPMMYVVGTADLDFTTKAVLGASLFGYCGIGQGILYVLMMPMLGEIIDYDEQRSGARREALYNGLSGVSWKSSMAASIFVATTSMSLWGNSVKDYQGVLLVGPIAGFIALVGLVAMLFYPVLTVARHEAPAAPDDTHTTP